MAETKTCPQCHGSGESMKIIDSERGSYTYESCGRCDGRGQIWPGSERRDTSDPDQHQRSLEAAIEALKKHTAKLRGPK